MCGSSAGTSGRSGALRQRTDVCCARATLKDLFCAFARRNSLFPRGAREYFSTWKALAMVLVFKPLRNAFFTCLERSPTSIAVRILRAVKVILRGVGDLFNFAID